MDGFFSQLPYKCHLEEVASVGDGDEIWPQLDSRVGFNRLELAALPALEELSMPRHAVFIPGAKGLISISQH